MNEELKKELEDQRFELLQLQLENNRINQEKIIKLLSDIKELLSK